MKNKLFIILIVVLIINKIIYAQWSPTGYSSGNINTVYANNNEILAGTNGGASISVSTDNGLNWSPANNGVLQFADVRAFSSNSNFVFAGASDGIYRTANNGTYIWTKVLNNVSCFALLTNGSTIYAGTLGGGFYISTDNGITWNQSNSGMTAYPYVYALAKNSSYIFAGKFGQGGQQADGVFRSSDNGASWTQVVNGLTNKDVFSLAVLGNYIFAGTNGGLFRSSDNGNNWINIPGVGGAVHTIKIVCNNDIYVGLLSSGGIGHSTDNGNTWTSFNNGLPNTGGYTVMSISSNNNFMFSGSLGGGISRATVQCESKNEECITWDLFNSTSVTSNSSLLIGQPELIKGILIYSPYTSQGQRLWGGNNNSWVYGGSQLDTARYVQFNFSTSIGNNFIVQNISFNYGDNTFQNDFHIIKSQVYYSKDNWVTRTLLSITPLDYLNTIMQQFSINGLYVPISNGESFSLRIFPYAPNGGIAMTPSFAIHNNVKICGTISSSPIKYSSICGTKFNDLNGNGNQDLNEPGLEGWTITLSKGAVQLSSTTDANGNYCFENLTSGTYTLSEINKNGWQQTFPNSPGNYIINLSEDINLIGYNFGNKEIINPSCTDFESNSLNGWQANNISTSFQQNGSNHYIQTTDLAGASSFYTTSKPYIGNWTSLLANGCGSLCFDVTFIYGGDNYNGQTPPQTLNPYIAIEGAGFSAYFIVNQTITVGDGWHSYCAPLSYLNSDGTLPSNSDGYWVMLTGTANDWNALLNNVTKVRLPVDPTSYQHEKIGYDNICLKNTGDCNPPQRLGSICGIKIHDKNGDGIKDGNEDGLPNWPITLTIGTTIYNTTTDAKGNYCFDNLPAGTYIVSEANLPGWRQIFPSSPGIHTVNLLPGEKVTNINFSNVEDISVRVGSICGIKFNDLNGDGIKQLNEPGLPNWTFQLTGAANQTTTTDLNGYFCFSNLVAGNYTVKEVKQIGWKPTTPDSSGSYSISLSAGQNYSELYFGNKEILNSICGIKFNDINGNGIQEDGEFGLANWTINLSGASNLSTQTDAKGNFCFDNLKAGRYIVSESYRDGWTQTAPSTLTYTLMLTAGQSVSKLIFGNKEDNQTKLGSICGIKFNDKNGNGIQDPGELGIPDWHISIGGSLDLTKVTDREGKFCFDNLPPGEYKVGEEARSGWRQTKPSTNFYIIQLASGQSIKDLQFGNVKDDKVQLGSICGTKFFDRNHDGRKGTDEQGIPNWTIYLEGPVNQSTITDDKGNYCFYNLIPGSYTIREANKSGWRQSMPSSITYSLEIGNGNNFTGIDFGNFEDKTVTLGSICGIKFNDLNGDGIKQDNEPVLPNWTIILSGTMNLVTKTDLRGKFCFDNLTFGRYTLTEEYKDKWIQTAPSSGSFSIELTEDNNNPDLFYFGNKENINIRNGSICGIKFNDKNGNGKQDDGELGIPNWQINLDGALHLSIKTDKEGKYCFDNLKPGIYVIAEETRPDWIQTFPVNPKDYSVVLSSGQNLKDYKFGNKYEPQNGCVQPPSGMVAWWSFDFSSKDSPQDLAGYNNFGTKMNGPIAVAGKVLGALQFDGIDDYVEVANQSELNFGTGDFSFDAWVKTDAKTGVKVMVDKRQGYNIGYSFFLNDGNLSIQLADGSFPNSYTNYASTLFVADGNWHHVAITVERKNKQGIIFYLDGSSIQYADPTSHTASLTNTDNLRIGRNSSAGNNDPIGTFKGILDEIELFNRVLTPAEIKSIFNAGSAGKCKPNGTTSTVWGHVFHDINLDGIFNGKDINLSNWTVFINGNSLGTTLTDEYGNFTFTDLKPGNYSISVVGNTGWTNTKPMNGTYSFELSSDIKTEALNFGFTNDPCISGIKNWQPLGSGLNGYVFALANDGNNLFAGGTFTTAGGIECNHIAKWNGTNWSNIGGGVNGPVNAIFVVGNDIYVAGNFTIAGNVNANNIAKWNGSNWSNLGNGTNGTVNAITMIGNDLYVGGMFTTAGGISANNIAKWNGSSWSSLDNGVVSNGNYGVLALASLGTDLYVGGNFWKLIGNNNITNIVKLNTLTSTWSPLSVGLNNKVYSLIVNNSELYVAGEFTNVGNHIAKWNGSTWIPLGSGTSGSVTGASRALAIQGNDLFIGGQYAFAGSTSANNISKWDGSDFFALSSGVSGFYYATVMSLTTIGSDLYAGGVFTIAGNTNANYIAKYSCNSITTSIYDDSGKNVIPEDFKLSQNFPNPFNPTTIIRFDIPKESLVKLTVYDILGRLVKTLVNENKKPGIYEVQFDAKNLASGIYFYHINTGNYNLTRKMILLK